MTYAEYQAKIIAAQEQWNAERSGIYTAQQVGQFSSLFAGDTQPPKIATPDVFDSLSLEEMQQAVQAMKPATVDAAAQVWKQLSTDLSTSVTGFNDAFKKSVVADKGWVGAAATAAVTAVNNYATQSAPLSAAALAVSLKLAEMRTGLEQTQALMPGLTTRPELKGKSLPADGVMKTSDYTREEAEAEARRVLRTVYSQVAGQTDTGVPYMPTAPKLLGADGDSSGPGGGGNPGNPAGANPNNTAKPNTSTPGNTNPAETTNETPTPGDRPNPAGTDTTTPQTTDSTKPTSTTPSTTPTTNPSSPTNPNTPGSTPLSTTPGSRSTGGSGSPGGANTPRQQTPGRSIPGGAGQTARPAAAALGATSGAAGRNGMPGMGAPGMGRGGGSDDESRRGIPDYLITQENGDLLTGLNDVRAVPPVIGGD
ncbi:hypothetical protein [Nocardia camponoti]|uniref:PPE domain-containing protein n=1 Tax=Nocardia camponoti TaxID=1616106 RepID=A0A917Q9J6_9NOCA|nr:hypothetical protein [Nocardia camponoti]GGK38625.1 hypothetical protein GCM10011591_07970 [Nocardia camponoti]